MKLAIKLFASVLLAVFALATTGCGSKKEDSKKTDSVAVEKAKVVKVTKLESQEINRSQVFSTTLEPQEQVHLVPTMPGRVKKINVDVGSRVSAGTILVEMDQTNLFQAKVQLANLKTELDRMTILLKSNSVSQQSYDQVKTQYDVAKSSVENLEENTYIKAPFAGIISGKYIEEGEYYSGGQVASIGKAAIVSLVQVNMLKAYIDVPESYYPKVKQGAKVDISSDIYSDKQISGTIKRVYPIVDPTTHTFKVEISIPNSSEQLKPGMFARVSLSLGKVDAIIVPSIVVLKTQGSNERYVYIDDNGKAKKVVVQLGQRFDEKVEAIAPELTSGVELVTTGQGKLINGDKLSVVK